MEPMTVSARHVLKAMIAEEAAGLIGSFSSHSHASAAGHETARFPLNPAKARCPLPRSEAAKGSLRFTTPAGSIQGTRRLPKQAAVVGFGIKGLLKCPGC